MIKIKLPSIIPSFMDVVWSRLIRDLITALEGFWGKYDSKNIYVSNNIKINYLDLYFFGKIMFINLSGEVVSGSDGYVILPYAPENETYIPSINCRSVIKGNKLFIENITEHFKISGVFVCVK